MEQEVEKTVSFFRFEDLRVYAKATDYASWVTKVLEGSEKFGSLVGAFSHSAFDIALNIAEGSSRSKAQFEHCLKVAKTAIRECVVYTELAASVQMFDEECKNKSREFLMELTRMVGALIISLTRGGDRRSASAEPSLETVEDPYANADMSY